MASPQGTGDIGARPPLPELLARRIQSINGQLRELRDMLHKAGDEMLGSEPASPTNTPEVSPPGHVMGCLTETERVLDQLRIAANRLA